MTGIVSKVYRIVRVALTVASKAGFARPLPLLRYVSYRLALALYCHSQIGIWEGEGGGGSSPCVNSLKQSAATVQSHQELTNTIARSTTEGERTSGTSRVQCAGSQHRPAG